MNNSLFITADLINKYGASNEDISFLKESYPHGIFVFEILSDEIYDVSIDFIHWMYYNLPLTKEDKVKYLNYVEITNTSYFYNSYNVDKCSIIADSIFCENSSYIFGSSYIKNSLMIYNSEDITESYQVFNSQLITNSQCVYHSNHITDSKDILFSNYIENSKHIGYSKRAKNSIFAVGSKDIDTVYLSRNLFNCSNKLLCFDLQDNNEYMILNKEVSKSQFDKIWRIFDKTLTNKLCLIQPIPIEKFEVETITKNIDIFFTEIFENITTPEILLFYNLFEQEPIILNTIKKVIPNFNRDLLYKLSFSIKNY